MTPDIKNNQAASRYELIVDGAMALADYRMEGTQLVITHVETPVALRGQGIAAKIMAGVVADAKARGLTIVPVCPYAAAYLKRNMSS